MWIGPIEWKHSDDVKDTDGFLIRHEQSPKCGYKISSGSCQAVEMSARCRREVDEKSTTSRRDVGDKSARCRRQVGEKSMTSRWEVDVKSTKSRREVDEKSTTSRREVDETWWKVVSGQGNFDEKSAKNRLENSKKSANSQRRKFIGKLTKVDSHSTKGALVERFWARWGFLAVAVVREWFLCRN